MSLSLAIAAALRDLDRELRLALGERLRLVRLFGSWARGEATEASDIDVAVVVQGLVPEDRPRIFDAVARVEDAHELALSVFLMSGSRFDAALEGGGGIARVILDEGVAP